MPHLMSDDYGFNYRSGEELKPSTKLRTYGYIGFVMGAALILVCLLPVLIFAPIEVSVILLIFFALIIVPWLVWVNLYFRSVSYRFTDTEMVWKRGVWFRATGIVPYTKVTNVDIVQGPIMRALGIASLRVQTAGYSGTNGQLSEIRIEGIQQYEPLREMIMSYVRERRPVAQTPTVVSNEGRMLEELVKIRELLERQSPRP
jgi:uncharacterized protein